MVSDGTVTDEEEIEITVNEVNVAPVLTVPANVITQWGVTLANLAATATDADIPANTLTFSTTFVVNRENAEGTTIANAGAAQLGAKTFTVTIGIKEARLGNGNEPDPNDGQLAGAISNVTSLAASASGVSTNGSVTGSCNLGTVSGSGYGAVKSFTCTFGDGVNPIPVDVYTLTFTVGGNYYTGTYEDVFSIWDPGVPAGGRFIGESPVQPRTLR